MTDNANNESFPQIPGFTITGILGRGGMAHVYLGVQDSMEREVAIKVLLPQLLADPSFGDRFLREARIAAKLAHPHIVSVIDVGVSGDLYYMAMEYQPGGDLTVRIRDGLPEQDALRIIREVAAALDYAHANGFVHRDIKPDNILFSRSGSAVLSDFGIARAADGGTQLTATGSIVGTPHYMSPEQAMGKPTDGRADLYSLGVMFYQMLTGKVPFDGESAMSIGIKHIRDPVPSLPPQLAAYQTLLDKLLAKEPDERWQSAADVLRTLEVLEIKSSAAGSDTISGTAVSDKVQAPVAATRGSRSTAGHKVSPPVLIAGVLVLLAVGAAIAWQQGLLRHDDPAGGTTIALQEPNPVAAVELPPPPLEKAAPETVAIQREDTAKTTVADTPAETSSLAAVSPRKLAPEPARKIAPKPAPMPAPAPAPVAEPAAAPAAKAEPATEPAPVQEPEPDPLQARLSDYVDDASEYLSPATLSESRLEAATRLYRSAYILAPNDPRVTRLPEQIAGAYEVLADEARLQKNWDAATRLTARGLEVLPEHRGLRKLAARIGRDKQAASEAESPRRVYGGF